VSEWSMVNGQWSMVNGQWSMVNGQWSIEYSKYLQQSFSFDKCILIIS
jgi:hypothetical protein